MITKLLNARVARRTGEKHDAAESAVRQMGYSNNLQLTIATLKLIKSPIRADYATLSDTADYNAGNGFLALIRGI